SRSAGTVRWIRKPAMATITTSTTVPAPTEMPRKTRSPGRTAAPLMSEAIGSGPGDGAEDPAIVGPLIYLTLACREVAGARPRPAAVTELLRGAFTRVPLVSGTRAGQPAGSAATAACTLLSSEAGSGMLPLAASRPWPSVLEV